MIFSFKNNVKDSGCRAVARAVGGSYLPKTPFRGAFLYLPAIGAKASREEVEALDEIACFVEDAEGSFFLSSRRSQDQNSIISIGDDLTLGTSNTVVMAGPCAVEDRNQAFETASFLSNECGVRIFRSGAFKPRTSPLSFQGTGAKGIEILSDIKHEFGMQIISEVKDSTHFDLVSDVADIIQVGTKAMYDPAVLKKCGEIKKPILLKRGFMSTIKEFLQAAEFILSRGNWRVILCERGIRSFEPETRFCLDLGAVAVIRSMSHLPIVVDPSHAIGKREFVADLACAGAAMGIDGLLVEVHRDPEKSFSDARQALSHSAFKELIKRVKPIVNAANRQLDLDHDPSSSI